MKKFLCFVLATFFVLSSFLIAGCCIASAKPMPSSDSSVFVVSSGPVGFYSLDSVATVKDGSVSSAAALGTKWEGRVLTEDYASVLLREDGSFVCSGAVQGDGVWGISDDGKLFANASFNDAELSSFGFDSFGLLFLDVALKDGTNLYLRFAK